MSEHRDLRFSRDAALGPEHTEPGPAGQRILQELDELIHHLRNPYETTWPPPEPPTPPAPHADREARG